jgi:hypothetical protein
MGERAAASFKRRTTMAYPKLSADDVKHWDDDYEDLEDKLGHESDDQKKAEFTAAMQSLAVKIEERLNADIQAARRYSKTRRQNADKFAADAEAELKRARNTAAAFKKKPGKTNLPAQLKQSIQKIADLEQDFQDDGLAYGAAWFDYRSSPVSNVPDKYTATYTAIQGSIVNDDKRLGVQLQKIIAAKHQAEALLAITDKAAMKADIKAGTGTQRPIADAQQAARDLATQMDTLLNLLHHPSDMSTPPTGIISGKGTLTGLLTDKKFWNNPAGMKTARSVWSNVQIANKLITTKAANMEKVLATRTRGFRTKELADPVVAKEMKTAADKVKEAKKEVKDRAADYAAAKKAMDKLEAEAKKRKIK